MQQKTFPVLTLNRQKCQITTFASHSFILTGVCVCEGGGRGLSGYALAPDRKKRFLTEKIGQLCRFCPVMPVTSRKKLIITDFLVKFCFIQN